MVIGRAISDLTKKLVFIILLFTFVSGQASDSLNVKSPKKAALWSILPGGGQIYNGKYLKAGILITLETLAIQQAIKNGNSYSSTGEDKYISRRNENAWWALFFHVYGTLDAVVDSHLKPFKEVMSEESFEDDSKMKEEEPNGK